MIKVKDLTTVVDKWTTVTPGRAAYYEAEASVAGEEWEKKATAAAPAFKAAVTAGNIDRMFTGGIKRAGAAKYNRKVKDVGAARFSSGIAAAGTDYSAGIAPYLDLMRGLTLPARAPRGSEANLARVRMIMVENNKKRAALRAAGV